MRSTYKAWLYYIMILPVVAGISRRVGLKDKGYLSKRVRAVITENGETALHVSASTKGHQHVEEFVKNLMDMMDKADLEMQNNNQNTALYLAAAAGNIKVVKIMVEKNRALLTIAGGNGNIMPLYAAALYGHEEVVKYMYNNSNVALEIVKTYPELDTRSVLGVLARKPEAFAEIKFNIILRTINWGKDLYSKMLNTHHQSQNEHQEVGRIIADLSRGPEPFPEASFSNIGRIIKSVSSFIGLKGHEKQDNALQLLRIIWENIVKKSKTEIDDIIRGHRM
ncbi:hypothetical protein L1987_86000 [Smallanthus sonchifolius]|uniref:Uncharacterized protein n=1 Tax=Smallanthus sonchifolius TaxID=185202 RepID=A0ACB8XYJ5_9ASTR|nr:hypothetical protein L1987_86000 [Smallanthus sonchifolius]